jgi:hypothetical protein
MTPEMESARAEIEAFLRHRLAAGVAIGANLASLMAGLPTERRRYVLRQLSELMVSMGEEPYSEAEACLMARIAERRPDLQDPAAVDLSDLETLEVAQQLGEVWRCIDARALARAQEVES